MEWSKNVLVVDIIVVIPGVRRVIGRQVEPLPIPVSVKNDVDASRANVHALVPV
jgi:hypothetical protein